jgi:S-methylmethionine-dependent homocysteine/selenocysteine methylase
MNMTKYRTNLPQLNGKRILTDGGLETVLVFQEGIDLPLFAAFHLLDRDDGPDWLRTYFDRYIPLAKQAGTGLLLESLTWRASPDWTTQLGMTDADMAQINRESITFLEAVRDAHETEAMPMVISGCVGPRGDGYDPGIVMTADAAQAYHSAQINVLADTAADMISALTMNNVEEAIGLTRAAQAADIPVAISFTVETDGRLPTGQTLGEAVAQVDAETGNGPAYFMINCAHPTHFEAVLAGNPRIRGLRANASMCSHEELDNCEELDDGNPVELGSQFAVLLRDNPQLTVLGGCCGTDHRHIEQIGLAVKAAA